ncbi:hypothetical protein BGZ65_001275 [Modicella reniformis]|uniref:Uncharacterized protein n=1 Tax=Modicella reniformis TaxID=1440133 RepID=A0A9P6J211_9FUNG|nr:hypothetical protein BGZ65_001275 [Modicella reniformis]
MAKKDKKGEGTVQNREIFQRMNFLYQAAMYMATITQPQPSSTPGSNSTNALHPTNNTTSTTTNIQQDISERTTTDSSIANAPSGSRDMDMDMNDQNINACAKAPSGATTAAADPEMHPSRKLSRRKKKELLRQRKNKIAMEQISNDEAHHSLTLPHRNRRLHPLFGTARFYASTLREVGRKNVIRIG